jgi:hypothetical protein
MPRELGDGLMQAAGPTFDAPAPIDELRKAIP